MLAKFLSVQCTKEKNYKIIFYEATEIGRSEMQAMKIKNEDKMKTDMKTRESTLITVALLKLYLYPAFSYIKLPGFQFSKYS